MWSAWGSFIDALGSGAPSFPKVHNATVYEYLAKHAELGVVFNRFMTAQSNLHNAAIVELNTTFPVSGQSSTSAEGMALR